MIGKSLVRAFGIAALTASFLASPSQAQEKYPSRPVSIVVPYAPGGSVDAVARIVAESLQQILGQPFVIENMPGAGATLGSSSVVRTGADGYKLLMVDSGQTQLPAMYSKLSYDPVNDLVPISIFIDLPMVVAVSKKSKAETLKDVITNAKNSPGKVMFSSGGIGTANHIGGEVLKTAAGVDIVHVPYKGGGPALADLVSGQVDLMVGTIAQVASQYENGNVGIVAVLANSRSPTLPNVPTAAEAGLDVKYATWFGMSAAKGTPQPILDILAKAVAETLAKPDVRKKLEALGTVVIAQPPTDSAQRVKRETAAFAELAKKIQLKPVD